MTSVVSASQTAEVFYPSSDDEPLAETSVHVDAIINTVVALRQYLAGQQAIVLADQFLYYVQGYPRLRVAPDIMVILSVPPGPRDNYKIWEEGQLPAVIFEMTSEGTKNHDQTYKKTLYEQLEIPEYWLFDPRGEWIPEKLKGYRLRGETYELITDSRCQPLALRLQIEDQLIGFYREDTGEKLLAPDDLLQALQQEILAGQEMERQLEQERQRVEQERQRAEQAESQAERLRAQLQALGIDPEA